MVTHRLVIPFCHPRQESRGSLNFSTVTKKWPPANTEGDRTPTACLGVLIYCFFGQENLKYEKPDYFCGPLDSQNIPATGNSFPAEEHAKDGNKLFFFFVNEESAIDTLS